MCVVVVGKAEVREVELVEVVEKGDSTVESMEVC